MNKYKLTQKAVEDLNEIWTYTFDHWSEEQADQYYLLLVNSCKEISINPNLGKLYKQVSSNLYGLRVDQHIIFYRKTTLQTVVIIRILHGRMDLRTRIRKA